MSILKKLSFTCEKRLFILAFLQFFLLLFVSTNAYAISRIAFTSQRDGNSEIYVMNADSSGQTRLTNNLANDEWPAWSPDGSKIAFSSDRDGDWEIYVMNADGSDQTRLTNSPGEDYWLAWSPDGSKIAFTSVRDGYHAIYVMNANGSGQTWLTAGYWPAWSPDGLKIAFSSSYDIYVMNANGSGQTQLTNNPAWDDFPAWSPDGSRITFTSNRDGGKWDIYVMNDDGSGQINLTNNPTWNDYWPAWSPDGSKIAFSSDRDGNDEVYIMNADGSSQTRLTNNPAWDIDPDWAPEEVPATDIEVTPVSCDFGSVTVGTSSTPQTFTISNTGTADLHISDMTLSDTTNYSLDVNGGTSPCGSTTPTITPDSSCTVTVTFNPSSKGIKNAVLTINSDDPDTPTLNVPLSGTGVPRVECNLVPDWPIVVQGGTLGLQGFVTNNTDEVQLFKYATRITLPSGNKYPHAGYLIGPIEVTLNPYQTKSKHLSQYIPHYAPLGTYIYHSYVGVTGPPVVKYDECTFTFTVNSQGHENCTACHQ